MKSINRIMITGYCVAISSGVFAVLLHVGRGYILLALAAATLTGLCVGLLINRVIDELKTK